MTTDLSANMSHSSETERPSLPGGTVRSSAVPSPDLLQQYTYCIILAAAIKICTNTQMRWTQKQLILHVANNYNSYALNYVFLIENDY